MWTGCNILSEFDRFDNLQCFSREAHSLFLLSNYIFRCNFFCKHRHVCVKAEMLRKKNLNIKSGYLNGSSRGHFNADMIELSSQSCVNVKCLIFFFLFDSSLRLELTSACKRINKDARYEFVTYPHAKKSTKFNALVRSNDFHAIDEIIFSFL